MRDRVDVVVGWKADASWIDHQLTAFGANCAWNMGVAAGDQRCQLGTKASLDLFRRGEANSSAFDRFQKILGITGWCPVTKKDLRRQPRIWSKRLEPTELFCREL